MDDKYLKPKIIDRILQSLLGVADSDTTDLAFVEPLVLFLADMSGRTEPAVFEHYCTLYSPVILRAVREAPVISLSYDTLSKMPSLVARIKEISPDSIPPDIDACLGEVRKRLAFYQRILEGEEYTGPQARSSAGEIKFITVYSGQGSGYEPGLGRIITARSRLEIIGEWSTFKRSKPIIAFEGNTLRPNDPFDEQIRTAVAFAEEHFKHKMNVGEIEKLPREYRFALSHEGSSSNLQTRFTGGSAGLAFALLSLTSIDSLGVRRDRRLIRSNVAFTGAIDRDGGVHPVDNAALGAKVRSVFLSTCGRLVLPKDNLAMAAEHLDELKKLYPKRSFELVPIEHVREAYDDERNVERSGFSAMRVMLNTGKRRKKHLAVALSSLVTLITLLLLLPPRFAHEISKYRFADGQVYFENRYNYNFGGYNFGYRVFDFPSKEHTSIDSVNIDAKTYQFFSGVVNGDGSSELLVASIESDSTETNPCGRFHAHLFGNDGQLLQHITWLDSLVHAGGDERRVFRKFYYCHGELIDLDRDDRMDHFAFSLIDRESYPGVIGLISLADGSLKSFAHVGYIPRFISGDFDRDGKMEIVAGGTSNGLNTGIIAVLDPGHMNGSSPDIFRQRFENLADDVAKYYIKLPRSALCGVPEMKVDKPEVTRINVDEHGMLKFGITEKDCGLIYSFDRNWRCIGIVPHTSYKSQYELLQKAYMLPELESHIEQLKNQIEYWTGTDWVRTPTMNGSYLRLVSRESDE